MPFTFSAGALAFVVALANAQCPAQRAADYGLMCPTPIVHVPSKRCAVTPEQRRTVNTYFGRSSLHHRSQVRYAFPRDESGQPMLAIFIAKPVSGARDSFEVVNTQNVSAENLVYERCGNIVHTGAPYGI